MSPIPELFQFLGCEEEDDGDAENRADHDDDDDDARDGAVVVLVAVIVAVVGATARFVLAVGVVVAMAIAAAAGRWCWWSWRVRSMRAHRRRGQRWRQHGGGWGALTDKANNKDAGRKNKGVEGPQISVTPMRAEGIRPLRRLLQAAWKN